MAHDLFEDQQPKPATQNTRLRLHRRLFLLVFAVAILWQTLLVAQTRLSQYYDALNRSFKVILTVDTRADNAALAQTGETLNQKADIASVKLFSSADALSVVQQQNPQLAQSLLLMGRNKMPAYFELRLVPTAVRNVDPLLANLAAEYKGLTPHYNRDHAQLLFTTGLCLKLLRMSMSFAGLVFLIFMFLVEAYPGRKPRTHYVGGMISGILAAVCAWGFFIVLVYPTGFLQDSLWTFTALPQQVLLTAFCAIFGWTLSKWQKF